LQRQGEVWNGGEESLEKAPGISTDAANTEESKNVVVPVLSVGKKPGRRSGERGDREKSHGRARCCQSWGGGEGRGGLTRKKNSNPSHSA